MHVGYALIVGASLARYTPHLITCLAGLAYPPFVLLVIVATGNHFFVDAAAGAAVAGVAFLAARLLVRPWPTPRAQQLPSTVWSAASTQNTTTRATAQRDA